jgi:RNA-directed DNA polymerase
MKTYRNLYPQVHDWDNLYLAYRKARKGKRGRLPAATFEYHLEANLVQLRQELAEKTYTPGDYNSFYIHEPKRRLISAAPFKDRVVHHALCNVIEPISNNNIGFRLVSHDFLLPASNATGRVKTRAEAKRKTA